MDQLKQQIYQKLVANVLIDKCNQNKNLIFSDAWCSQERVIRFTTHAMRELFPLSEDNSGKWKTGDEVMYEIVNDVNKCIVNCTYQPINSKIQMEECLKSWDISNEDQNILFGSFDKLINNEIPSFEKELKEKLHYGFTEGEQITVTSTKYERNPKAREACLKHHGYTCKICGMNFEEVYGADFKEIIEVHHIVPLNQIGEMYIVDPIKDLIPVCPNCHTAIHSKAGSRLIDKINK